MPSLHPYTLGPLDGPYLCRTDDLRDPLRRCTRTGVVAIASGCPTLERLEMDHCVGVVGVVGGGGAGGEALATPAAAMPAAAAPTAAFENVPAKAAGAAAGMAAAAGADDIFAAASSAAAEPATAAWPGTAAPAAAAAAAAAAATVSMSPAGFAACAPFGTALRWGASSSGLATAIAAPPPLGGGAGWLGDGCSSVGGSSSRKAACREWEQLLPVVVLALRELRGLRRVSVEGCSKTLVAALRRGLQPVAARQQCSSRDAASWWLAVDNGSSTGSGGSSSGSSSSSAAQGRSRSDGSGASSSMSSPVTL